MLKLEMIFLIFLIIILTFAIYYLWNKNKKQEAWRIRRLTNYEVDTILKSLQENDYMKHEYKEVIYITECWNEEIDKHTNCYYFKDTSGKIEINFIWEDFVQPYQNPYFPPFEPPEGSSITIDISKYCVKKGVNND